MQSWTNRHRGLQLHQHCHSKLASQKLCVKAPVYENLTQLHCLILVPFAEPQSLVWTKKELFKVDVLIFRKTGSLWRKQHLCSAFCLKPFSLHDLFRSTRSVFFWETTLTPLLMEVENFLHTESNRMPRLLNVRLRQLGKESIVLTA